MSRKKNKENVVNRIITDESDFVFPPSRLSARAQLTKKSLHGKLKKTLCRVIGSFLVQFKVQDKVLKLNPF